jgi:hypothetical protein
MLKLYLKYRDLASLVGDGFDLGSDDMAEDVLACDYTLAARRVVYTMRSLKEGDKGGVDEALKVALT